jgi:hypothetical protein
MISKKKASAIAYRYEDTVFSNLSEISTLIEIHAKLGHFHLEVFITNKLAKRCKGPLESKGYYVNIGEIESTPNQCLLYISW